MVGDLDDHKIRSMQNFRPLVEAEAYDFYNGIDREGGGELGREGHFVCCLELLHN